MIDVFEFLVNNTNLAWTTQDGRKIVIPQLSDVQLQGAFRQMMGRPGVRDTVMALLLMHEYAKRVQFNEIGESLKSAPST